MQLRPAVLACIAAAFVGAVAAACGSSATGFDRYVDPAGWSFRYAHGLQVEHSSAEMRINVAEATVADFRLRRPIRTGHRATSGWLRVDPPENPTGVFPKDGVAFRMSSFEGGPAPDLATPESRFPLRLRRFRPAGAHGDNGASSRELEIVADGRRYLAAVWIGPDASASGREALARLVSSVSFPKLRPRSVIGDGFTVLAPADRYPVGSFTRVRAEGQPFYLVRAPGGFYAIGWRWQSLEGGYKSRCALELDRRTHEFFCTNLAARWDRVGRIIRRPAGAARDDPLNVAVAKLSWDGHVLLASGTASFADKRYARRMWPPPPPPPPPPHATIR